MIGPGGLPALGIRRPALVLVINLLIALAGIAALLAVDVRELPDVDRPVVMVRAQFPGAAPETLDSEVTSLIEGAVARVSGVRELRSSSEEDNARVRVEFSPGVDLDTAASDVREAVSRVERQLPTGIEQLTVVKADDDAGAIINVAAVSDSLTQEELARTVEQDIVPEIISIDGVADVNVYGDRQRALHVAVDPLRLASYGLAITDVSNVLRSAPLDVPAGSFHSKNQDLIVRADASAVTAAQVKAMIVRGDVRVGDVANVYFGPEDAQTTVQLNDRSVVGMGVVRQAQSNTIDISDAVRRAVQRLNSRLPNVRLEIIRDDATFIRGAVGEVLKTLLLSVVIVIGTIWLFVGSLRVTLLPSAAIPLALIGTIAAIWAFGFSINILTLLALVLSTGLVVDDAIVVTENIQRRRGHNLGPRAAAVLGTRQVFFAVVATTAVLISVFVPISFLPSTAGRMFREFGFVLAVAVAISAFVSLSLVPMLSARLPVNDQPAGPVWRVISGAGDRLAEFYQKTLLGTLAHPWVVVGLSIAMAGGAAWLFTHMNRELLPPEDRGIISINGRGPDGVGLNYTARQAARIERILQPYVQSGDIRSLFTIVGRGDPNNARVVAPLAPWDARPHSQQEITAELQGPLAQIPGARVTISSPNSLDIGGGDGGLSVALLGNDYPQIFTAAQALRAAIERQAGHLSQPQISYQPTQPQLAVEIDRRRAADLGVPLEDVAAALRAMINGDEIVDLNVDDESVPLLLESSAGKIANPSDLVNLYVRAGSGNLVPLSSIAKLHEEGVAAQLDRYAQQRAIRMDVDVDAGYPLQSALDDVRELADEVLPTGISMIPVGAAATLEQSSHEAAMTYVIALLVVFLVLWAQFESYSSALVICLTVPFGIAAAIFALFLSGTSINLYSEIGLVMLIGLMAKNGILLVEFADQLRDRGQSVREAVLGSARIRLRPVAMTMTATVVGALPLILSGGAGAEARNAIGWVVFGGLALAAVFTLYLTPVLYMGLGRFSRARAEESQLLGRELDDADQLAGEY
ncbi:MAG TPA: efflux RND transporter permease subunit [Gammaproteobacteria bacterium]|nr:efflux RND transporter permease subunit [Gammaproteobacteria bacterium]